MPQPDHPLAAQPPTNDLDGLFNEDAELAVPADSQPTGASSIPQRSAAEISAALALEGRPELPAHTPQVVAIDPKAAAAVQPGAMASLGSNV